MTAEMVLVLIVISVAWSAILWLTVCTSRQRLPWYWNWSRLWQWLLLLSLTPLLPAIPAPTMDLVPNSLLQPLATFTATGEQLGNPIRQLTHSGNPVPLLALSTVIFLACISLYKLIQFAQSLVRIYTIIGAATPLETNHKLYTTLAHTKLRLRTTKTPVPPFVFGVIRPVIVLPESVMALPQTQLTLIVEHELSHIQRLDPLSILLIRLITCLLWFNPFIHAMERRFLVTMELNCDAQTLLRCKSSSIEYARTLISCLKSSASAATSTPSRYATFLGDQSHMNIHNRIKALTQTGKKQLLSTTNKTLLSIMALSVAFFSLAAKSDLLPSATTVEANAGIQPVANARLSSAFAVKQGIRKNKPHKGIDLAAPTGTQVTASFGGTVIIADDSSLHPNYGKTVVIQHDDNFQTVYAHLNSIAVAASQTLMAGDNIGTVGATGKATGPHLHFEVLHNGEPQNPQRYLQQP